MAPKERLPHPLGGEGALNKISLTSILSQRERKPSFLRLRTRCIPN